MIDSHVCFPYPFIKERSALCLIWLQLTCAALKQVNYQRCFPDKRPCPTPPADSDLLAYGLQVSVPHKVLPQLHSGQSGAPGVREELEEALLGFKVTVCVDQLHVPAEDRSTVILEAAAALRRAGRHTYVLTSLSQISLGRKMSERRHSLFWRP